MSTSADTKRAALDRALEHIRAGAQDRLRYAALDLRLCLETMTLEKLRLYRRYLPASFSTETWQPYKQLRAMVQIDSIADQSFVLLAGPESVQRRFTAYTVDKPSAKTLRWISPPTCFNPGA